MKVRINTRLFKILVAMIGTLASLNIAATQSITTATSAAPPQMTGSMGMSMGGGPGYNGNNPGSGPTDSYWHDVRGDDFTYTGVTRTYYIAAEEVVWNYAPDGKDMITGENFAGAALNYVNRSETRIGTQYLKCLYFEYTNARFNQRKPRPAADGYLGFLGPTVRGEVGDIIKIEFHNKCRFPASVHPHAVFYNKDSEGAPYNDGTTGRDTADDAVPTGGKHTFTWLVPERAGPGPMDGSSVMWMYHSHTDENKDFYAGLIGCMEVTRKGMGKADGSPIDVDREIFIMYSIMNENVSPYLAENFKRFSHPTNPLPTDPGFGPSNQKNSINGYIYGNGPMITLKKGERVRWYLMSMGSFGDAHTPQWHGNTVLTMGMRMDVVSVLAAEMVTADMCPDSVGIWMFHCHVGDHLNNGMATRYEVKDTYGGPKRW